MISCAFLFQSVNSSPHCSWKFTICLPVFGKFGRCFGAAFDCNSYFCNYMFVLLAKHAAESCKSIYFCFCSYYVHCSCWACFAGTKKTKVLKNFPNLSVKIRGQYTFYVSVLLPSLQAAVGTRAASYVLVLELL